MKVTLKAIRHLVKTGCAIDITYSENIKRRPFNTTIIFHSIGQCGLNGLVIRDDETGQLYAVIGRVTNLFVLAA